MCQVATALRPAASASTSRCSLAARLVQDRDVLRGEVVVRRLQRVRLGDRRQQPALVGEVVHQRGVHVQPGAELAPALAPADGDRQRVARDREPGAGDADPALHQRADHREEAGAGGGDRATRSCRRRSPCRSGRAAPRAGRGRRRSGSGRCRRPAAPSCRRSPRSRRPSSSLPSSSRSGTTKACTPRASPATSSWAKTAAIRPCRAALPIQSLRASSSGVCRTNSCAAAS